MKYHTRTQLSMVPVVGAIAAGNTVILKVSTTTTKQATQAQTHMWFYYSLRRLHPTLLLFSLNWFQSILTVFATALSMVLWMKLPNCSSITGITSFTLVVPWWARLSWRLLPNILLVSLLNLVANRKSFSSRWGLGKYKYVGSIYHLPLFHVVLPSFCLMLICRLLPTVLVLASFITVAR